MMILLKLLAGLSVVAAAHASPFDEYILAPSSRTLHPLSIHKVNGTVRNPEVLLDNARLGHATFVGNSSVTYDYQKNIGGIVSLQFASGTSGCVGVTFTESSLWISGIGCDGTADSGIDAPLWFCAADADAHGHVAADRFHDRGSFRYLSLIRNGTGSTEIVQVSTHFTAMPHIDEKDLRNYSGYFHSSDEKLNRVWYAGAYTNQLCTIDPKHGDALIFLRIINSGDDIQTPLPWNNSFTITNGSSCLVDGAKRDRLVWAGDMAIAVPGIAVSTNDLVSVKNSLISLMMLQGPDGRLPYSGTPFNELGLISFTYHTYTILGLRDLYFYSGDIDFLAQFWDQFKLAMSWSLSSIDDSGLMNVTSPNDWLRFGMGGHNIEANSILFFALNQGIELAEAMNDSSVIQSWRNIADTIKVKANDLLWSDANGLYIDNETTTLSPQDGNVWAVRANLTDSPSKIASISSQLQTRWTPFGAPAPEAADAISPFISGFELQAHFLAEEPKRALDLIRLMWSDFMLDDPRMTNSTFIEGYSSSGDLHYAPYTNDPRVSHAHGWATGPTSSLTFYIAGIQLLSPGGAQWLMAPQFGDLEDAEAGFETNLGMFTSSWKLTSSGLSFNFSAPSRTMGSMTVVLPDCSGRIRVTDQNSKVFPSQQDNGRVTVDGLVGGAYKFALECI
ncbi:bacterial alpha-L-rhamnosidase domain-containing protein [Mycena floridula]|nr:bacterial alpha-L-rhamnosidase domain-containing protein [Mycena floridula]